MASMAGGWRLTLALQLRGLVSGNRDLGVLVSSESIATFEDVVIEDTQEQASDGSGGWGLDAGRHWRSSFTRGLVSGNRDVGVLVARHHRRGL